MLPPRRPCFAIAIALFAAAMTRCGSEDAPPDVQDPTAARPATIRLLDRLADAEFDTPDDLSPPTRTVLLQSNLADDLETPWFEGAWERASSRGKPAQPISYAAVHTLDDSSRAAVIDRRSRGLHRLLDTDSQALVVRARVRCLSEAGAGDVTLRVAPLSRSIPPIDWTASLPKVPGIAQSWRLPVLERHWTTDEGEASEWTDLELHIPWSEPRRAVRISLIVAAGAVAVQTVDVERLSSVETMWRSDQAHGRETEGLDVVTGEHLQAYQARHCLRLRPGWTIAFPDITMPALDARLDASVNALPTGHDIDASVHCEFDGVPVATHHLTGSNRRERSFEPWRTDLSAFAGRTGTLSFELACDRDDTVVLIGAPWILGQHGGPRPPNVVLVSLDTLRSDHLGTYTAQTASDSPNLDALGRRGVVFEQMHSPSAYTLPTHVTLMTGQSPVTHGVVKPPARIHPSATRTLAEQLRDEGYCTAAFTGGGYLHPIFGLSRGFDSFEQDDPGGVQSLHGGHGRASSTTGPGSVPWMKSKLEPTLDWIDRFHDQPFFLFLHTFFVHNYTADPRYLSEIDPSLVELDHDAKAALWDRARLGDLSAARTMNDLYRATVRQVDAVMIPALIERLEAHGLREGTVLMIVSDHGEEFVEHGTIGHGAGLWNSLVRVPWIADGPGIPQGRRGDLVSLQDVAPTILALCGLPQPSWVQGRDVFAERQAETARVLHLDTIVRDGPTRWDGLVDGRWKLLRNHLDTETGALRDRPQLSLFDIVTDPHEARDLASEQTDLVARLEARLGQRLETFLQQAPHQSGESAGQDAALAEALERLGYVHRMP